jgi:hypothetical protein
VWGSRKKDQLAEVLRHALDTSNNKYADIDEEDDFQVRLLFPFSMLCIMDQISIKTPNPKCRLFLKID